jgi:cell division protein FtsI/penicillin-binding protein 2
VGYPKMREYFLDKYKLAEETGVDLPGEVHGIVTNLAKDKAIEFATASFGQGIATTPLATLRALTAVANGGILVVPHVATAIQYPGGFTKKLNYDDQKVRVLSEETSLSVSRILASIVDEKLKDGKLRQEHYTVGAKTGTAQIHKSGGGYYTDRYLHTFFGFVPAYNPKYVILLVNVEPQGAKYSSETLSHPFMDVVTFLINYYNIAPDR